MHMDTMLKDPRFKGITVLELIDSVFNSCYVDAVEQHFVLADDFFAHKILHLRKLLNFLNFQRKHLRKFIKNNKEICKSLLNSETEIRRIFYGKKYFIVIKKFT